MSHLFCLPLLVFVLAWQSMACPSFWLNLQVGPKESSWDQFRMSGISFDSAAGLGGQLRFLKETPTKSTKGSARPLAGRGVHRPCSIDLGDDCRGLMKGRTNASLVFEK